jgi:hypothetical protein
MRALTWEHYCKYQYVLPKEELWVDVSLEFLKTQKTGEKGWSLHLKAFLIRGETGCITSFYYILALALQLKSR